MNAAPPRYESLRLLITAVKDSPLPPQIVIRVWEDKTTLHVAGCSLDDIRRIWYQLALSDPYVLGRKNYLFHQSPEGAESSCGIYTLIETAKQNGIEPLQYLDELFEKAPYAAAAEDWEKLLPWNIFNS